jgi:hypothetical protein
MAAYSMKADDSFEAGSWLHQYVEHISYNTISKELMEERTDACF